MKTLTLAQLRTRVRSLADQDSSNYISDALLDAFINDAIDELWDLLVSTNEDYGMTSASMTFTTNVQTLPANFYKMRGLDDMADSSNPKEVLPFSFIERNRYSSPEYAMMSSEISDVQYHIVADTLVLYPPELAPGVYRIWFVPPATTLSAPTDTFDSVSGWHKFVVAEAAIQCLIKEESSTTAVEKLKEIAMKRVLRMAPSRDQSYPKKIARVRNRSTYRDRFAT